MIGKLPDFYPEEYRYVHAAMEDEGVMPCKGEITDETLKALYKTAAQTQSTSVRVLLEVYELMHVRYSRILSERDQWCDQASRSAERIAELEYYLIPYGGVTP